MKVKSLLIVLSVVLLLAACAPMAKTLPTQTAAATLAPTATESPTATPRPTQTPTPTPEPYAIDLEKLSRIPPNIEYLRDHPSEFVQAPDPFLQGGVQTFNQWIDEKLDPALGPHEQRDVNVVFRFRTVGGDSMRMSALPSPERTKPTGTLEFFYFEHDGVLYPTYILTGVKVGKDYPISMAVVLTDGLRDPGMNYFTMEQLSSGDYYFGATVIFSAPYLGFAVEGNPINDLIDHGFGVGDSNVPHRLPYGFGAIMMLPNP